MEKACAVDTCMPIFTMYKYIPSKLKSTALNTSPRPVATCGNALTKNGQSLPNSAANLCKRSTDKFRLNKSFIARKV